jgi:hypothetical protein
MILPRGGDGGRCNSSDLRPPGKRRRHGGEQPLWRRDGRELYYISPDKKLIAVDVASEGSTFTAGVSRIVMETRSIAGWDTTSIGSRYAVTADGERFLMTTATEGVSPITLTLNWTSALNK